MLSYSLVMSLLFITVIAFTIIGVLYSKGKIETTDDFLTARGSTGSKTLTATFLASFLGVFILFTPPEAGAIGGITTIIGYGIGVASLYLGFAILSPRIRTYLPEGSTLNDYSLKRYGSKMYTLTLLLSIFYMFVHIVAELTAISQVAYQLAGIPLIYTALLVGIGTMIYTTYGGLKASMFTDLIQMILIIILLIIVTIGVLFYTGGIAQILEHTSLNRPDLLNLKNIGGIKYGLTLCIGVFAANLFHQGYWQRVYSGKNNTVIKKSLITCMIIVLPIMIITGLMGIAAAGLGLGDNPSVAMFSLIYSMFPKGLIVVVFILALVLVMSTVDTLLNAMVATLSISRNKNNKVISLKIARIITVLLVFASTLLASKGYSVLYLFLVADLVCAGVFVPLFWGLFDENLSENISILAAILGVSSGIPSFIANNLLIAFLLPIIFSSVICFLGSTIKNRTSPIN